MSLDGLSVIPLFFVAPLCVFPGLLSPPVFSGAVEVMASAHVFPPPWPQDAPGNREERGGNVRHESAPIGQGG